MGATVVTTMTAISIVPPARATEWDITPRASLGLEYVDNPLLAPPSDPNRYTSGTEDLTSELSAGVVRHADRLDLTIDPRVYFARYRYNQLLNQNNEYLDIASAYKAESSTWSAGINAARDTTLTSEIGLTGLTNANRRHESLAVTLGPTVQITERLSASAQMLWSANHYDDATHTGLVDYRYSSADGKGSYALSERTTLAIDASVGQSSVSQLDTRTTNYSLDASVTRLLSELWTITASLGPSRVESDAGSENGVVYGVNAQRSGELVNFGAGASRAVIPTGRGTLTKRDQALLSVGDALTEQLTIGLSGQLSQNRDLLTTFGGGTSPYTVRYYSVEIDCQWRFAPSWSTSLALQDQRQFVSSSPSPTSIAQGYRANISIVWSGFPYRIH